MLGKPLFCFLLALHVPLTYFADNQSLFEPSDIVRTILLFQIGAAICYWLAAKFFKSPLYAMVAAGLPFIVLWFSGFHLAFGPLAALGLIFCLAFLEDFFQQEIIIELINIVAIAILLQPVYSIITFQQTDYSSDKIKHVIADREPFLGSVDSKFSDASVLPSILHITLDAYSNDAVLSEVLGFDNSKFTGNLKRTGFVVFEKAVAPYNQTLFTMASIFSSSYISEKFFSDVKQSNKDRRKLARLMRHGNVRQTLNQLGYTFAYNDSGYYRGFYPDQSFVLDSSTPHTFLNIFEFMLLRHWHIEWISNLLSLQFWQTGVLDQKGAVNQALNDKTRNAFNSDFTLYLKRPFLYHLHIISPHPPFTIDRNGNDIDKWAKEFGTIAGASHATNMQPSLQKKYAEGYIEKLQFTNQATFTLVKNVIEGFKDDPLVIIIHGDHGSGVLTHTDSLENTCLFERFSPYLAIYSNVPTIAEKIEKRAEGRFNLTNIYPLLFEAIFDQPMKYATNKSFYVNWINLKPHYELMPEQLYQPCDIPW